MKYLKSAEGYKKIAKKAGENLSNTKNIQIGKKDLYFHLAIILSGNISPFIGIKNIMLTDISLF